MSMRHLWTICLNYIAQKRSCYLQIVWLLVDLDDIDVSTSNITLCNKLLQCMIQAANNTESALFANDSRWCFQDCGRIQVSFKDDNCDYSLSCSDSYSKLYRSADPPRGRRQFKTHRAGGSSSSSLHALSRPSRPWSLRSLTSQLLRRLNKIVSPSKHGHVRNCELWCLSEKVPGEPETHLKLFHREPIWGTWLALHNTFKITTFH